MFSSGSARSFCNVTLKAACVIPVVGPVPRCFPLLPYESRTYSKVKLKENRNSTHSLFWDDDKREGKELNLFY